MIENINIYSDLKKLKCGSIIENIDLSKYTSYKLKGKAKCLVIPDDQKKLVSLLKYIKKNEIPYKIIGGGSNLIFGENYNGVLIKLDKFKNLKIKETKITVGAGYPLMVLANKVSRLGLTGMEFATGIPGTVGGAIFNNSGAYKSDMGYIVESVLVLTPSLELKRIYNKDLDFHYRTSFLKNNPEYICLEANIILKNGDKEEIKNIIEDRKKRRLMSQPLEYPSAGSVFRNPTDLFAGKLIEDIGYKGKKIGGAMVSEKHANFIINIDGATGKDIIRLIYEIKQKVKEKYNVELVLEQEIVK